MSKRPILSLKRKSASIENKELTVSEPEKEKPKFNQEAFDKKARKERMKRYRAAFEILKSLNLPMPISKGLGKSLFLQLREHGVSKKAFSWAMNRLTHSDDYLNAVLNGKCRFHLDGTEAELITDEEREYSRSIIEHRKLTS